MFRQSLENAGTGAGGIELIAVSKTVGPERIREAYEAGIRDFGENRMQELVEKAGVLPHDIKWHFIGRLQTNKVRYLFGEPFSRFGGIALIQSVDRPELATEIARVAGKKGVAKVPCLLQVNFSGEATKAGFAPPAVVPFLNGLPEDGPLEFRGLMTIGPLSEDEAAIRRCFRAAAGFREELKKQCPRFSWDILSMGMSGDYKIAIEEGANMIRVGSLIFGARKKP